MAENKETKNNQAEEEQQVSVVSKLIVPIIIVVILAVFAGVVYWAKFVKPSRDIDKEAGYAVDEQITLGQYTGFDYEITQEMWDECVNEENHYYSEVKRAAQDTDQVDYNYTGYVDGKKDGNISEKEAELVVGDADADAIFKKFSAALAGHKAGEKVTVEASGEEATTLSKDESAYTNDSITFELKVVSVSEQVVDEINDKWVKENYFDDYGLETTEDFYEWCKSYIEEDEVKPEVWQMAVDAANMKKYPQELYEDIVQEFMSDAEYRADSWGMTLDEYLYDFNRYTEESLEEEYLNGVKSELVMWAIVKEENITASDEEIEERYEDSYEDVGCESVEEMKELYSKEEMKKAVLLDKCQDFVIEHSNIKSSYTIQ